MKMKRYGGWRTIQRVLTRTFKHSIIGHPETDLKPWLRSENLYRCYGCGAYVFVAKDEKS